MKKFFAFLLTFAMLFSLTMPAMAAEITGGTEGEVSATFNPDIYITNMYLENSNIEGYDNRIVYDTDTNTYTCFFVDEETSVPFDWVVDIKNHEYADLSQALYYSGERAYATSFSDAFSLYESDGKFHYGVIVASSLVGSETQYGVSLNKGTDWKEVTVKPVQAYSITNGTASDANGTITVPEWAKPGDTVTVNVTPNENYGLNELTVTGPDGEITVTNNQFTMPNGKVTVSATFKYTGPHDITVNASENGSVSADMQTATAGTTVTLTVDPADDYRLATLTINDGAVTATKVDDTTYTFTMPEGAVTVSATFELIPGKVTNLTIIVDGAEYEGPDNVLITPSTKTVSVKLYGTHLDRLGNQADVVIHTNEYPLYDGNWQFSDDNTTATMDIAPEVFADLGYGLIWFRGDDDYKNGLFFQYEVRTFSVTNNTAADANGTLNAPTKAEECSTVTLTWTTDSAYTLKNIVVKDEAGNDVPITNKDLTAWTFVMPDSNVTVTATFEKIPVTSVEITWGSMSFTYDDTIDETTNAEKGWSPDSAEGAATVTVKNTGETTFTAQATYTSYEGYESIIGSFDPASVELAPASSEQAGEEFTFTLELKGKPTKAIPAGTKIGKVTITINEAAEG